MNFSWLPFALGLAVCFVLVGCATVPAVGSKTWHQGRILEIDAAHDEGELSAEDYLTLKNDADRTRVEYQKAASERLQRRPSYYYYPHSFHGHHRHR